MAELTPLDEKLGEVLGLAQAAQAATEKVAGMEGAEDFQADLQRMNEQAAETEQRTDALVDGLEGRKTAIRDKARDTKGEATEMMQTYLEGEEEALDGFEFLSMAEAGELCHWEIVEKMADTIGANDVLELARWAVPVQRAGVGQDHRRAVVVAGRAGQMANGDRAVQALAITHAELPSNAVGPGAQQLVPPRELLAQRSQGRFHRQVATARIRHPRS